MTYAGPDSRFYFPRRCSDLKLLGNVNSQICFSKEFRYTMHFESVESLRVHLCKPPHLMEILSPSFITMDAFFPSNQMFQCILLLFTKEAVVILGITFVTDTMIDKLQSWASNKALELTSTEENSKLMN